MLLSAYNKEKSALFTGRILLELMYNQRPVNVPNCGGKTLGIRAISMGQDPRGFVHGPHRPDHVKVDDIQSRKRARSQKFVLESVEQIMQDLIPARAEGYSTVMVATIRSVLPVP
jgi:hypothetical protein